MNIENKAVNTLRMLSVDQIENANSGHPGLPLGAAPMAYALFKNHLVRDSKDLDWKNRDRFVLSAGHGSALLYSLFYLFDYGLSLDDLKNFRQLDSRTPGHPEYGHTRGVEATTGPLGQGIAMAVGMAIAEEKLAALYNKEDLKLVDHYTYALVGDGCLMEGISNEASSLAGTLKLNKLIVLYDSNKISIEGSTDLAFSENVCDRYKALGWDTFVVPDSVGGRFTVLTAVGLLPIAAAGADISKLMEGANAARETYASDKLAENEAYQYAVVRNILYRKGYLTEVLANYEPSLQYFSEWWKQLAGESEGKDQKGIYPTSANFSTDLHSLGQFIQEGTRILFETVIRVDKPRKNVLIPELAEDLDGLGYLQGKDVDFVNKKATDGVLLAHTDGGVPNMFVTLPEQDEFTLGYTIYFFELAIALSGYLNGINPFDQPGVEAYKKNMFALLGKPGFEELGAELNARL